MPEEPIAEITITGSRTNTRFKHKFHTDNNYEILGLIELTMDYLERLRHRIKNPPPPPGQAGINN